MKTILLILFSLVAKVTFAQLSLVAQNLTGNAGNDNFSVFVKVGNRVVFNQGSVDNAGNSSGLWQSDGTVEGTSLLHGSARMIAGAPYHTCTVGNQLFFVSNSGGGLWKTDGTPDGTQKIIEQYAGNNMGELANLLIFSVPSQNNSETTPSGLWRSDGTPSGTFKFADITAQYLVSNELDGFLYFMANEIGAAFPTLWKTNGTTQETVKVSSDLDTPWGFTRLGDKLIFKARYHHPPVACNRGTSENPIIEYYPQEPDAIMQIHNGVLSIVKESISTDYRPYGADGCLVRNYQSTFMNTTNFFKTDNYVFFLGQEPVPRAMNNLWRTDGTTDGTVKLTDFPDGDLGISYNYFGPNTFRDRGHKNIMFFPAHTAGHGSELWRSDGTPEGTFMLKDINPGSGNSYPNEMRTINDITYFFAYNPEVGEELWKTDGTVEGTVLVTDLNPGAEGAVYRWKYESQPHNFFGTSIGNDYVFGGVKGTTVGLFSTKNIIPPPTIVANLTEHIGNCANCEVTLPRVSDINNRNQYDLFTRGHFSTPVAEKYNISWDKSRWNFTYQTRNSGTIIEEWHTNQQQAYNGLNTSPKPPCKGWSNGLTALGDCQNPIVTITGPGAPAIDIATIKTSGIVNNKNAYEIPIVHDQEGKKMVVVWDGNKWTLKLVTPNARTLVDQILSVNNLDYGPNPPCGSWSNGYELSGDICSQSSLPVTLISFLVQKIENQVLLSWRTASESNSDHFEIQHSMNGKSWDVIGSVTANFESQVLTEYKFIDEQPEAGNNLYRLKMLDRDGTSTFSRSRSVQVELSTVLSPNPTSKILTVRSKTSKPTEISVTDLTGRIHINRKLTESIGSSKISLDVSNLPGGLYLLLIKHRDGQEIQRFIKE